MHGVIIGVSGGDLASTSSLNEYAIKRTGKEHPHVLFIPTASNDAEGYIDLVKERIEKAICKDKIFIFPARRDIHEEIKDYAMFVSSSDFEIIPPVFIM